LILLTLLGLWAITMGAALIVARDRLTSEHASLRDELLARGVAFLAASLGIFSFSLAATLITTSLFVFSIALPAWLLSVLPLFLPPLRRRDGRLRVSSETWVRVSVGMSVAGGVAVALFVLVRLLLTRPELV
jgi:drug/metabolite transporter (DMT)-like permease